MNTESMKVAVPLRDERVSGHFGHPDCFSLVSVDLATRKVLGEERIIPPPHEPGRLPVWLWEHGAQVVLAGGIGHRAVSLMEARGMEVWTGVPPLTASEAVQRWIEGNLVTAENACNHDEADHRCGDHGSTG